MSAIDEIEVERERQKSVEGWTPDHDDQHGNGELALAAGCYALNAGSFDVFARSAWPWGTEWWKPTTPRRDLVKAAALIVAEIERIDRSAASGEGEG